MSASARPPPGYTPLAVAASQILLQLTISNKCGQAFRWRGVDVYELADSQDGVKQEEVTIKQEDGCEEQAATAVKSESTYHRTTEWSICLADRVVFVRQDEARGFLYFKTLMGESSSGTKKDALQVEAETAAWLRDYLNLDVPLTQLYEEWSAKDAVFERFAKRFSGIRMLRQDPWETLCAFICSSNNNIARIGQMVQNLCTHFSEPLATVTYPPPPAEMLAGDEDVRAMPMKITYYPFPSVVRLAGKDVEAKLRNLAFGYRARYIQDTAGMLLDIVDNADQGDYAAAGGPYEHADQYLHSLRKMDYAAARQQLTQFPGVGPKVADCILLMAMDQPSSIPVDRHVFQFAERWYKIRTKGGHKGYEQIADTFRQLWGPYAGWAHSVLFTADLRAFQTYKVEETVKAGMLDVKPAVAQHDKRSDQHALEEQAAVPEPYVKIESAEITWRSNDVGVPAVVHATESPRTRRWKKRTYTDVGTSTPQDGGDSQRTPTSQDEKAKITRSFKGTKRTRPLHDKRQS